MSMVNYDKISEIYDLVRTGDREVVACVLDSKALNSSSRILEVGCGSGNNTVLIKAATGAEVYGMDQSRGMLDKAIEKDSSINFSLGDATLLEGFLDNSFDIIYMVDVIHHIKDIGTMFKNIYRTLKADGMVFIFTDTHEKIITDRLTSKYFPETIEVELERYQTTEQIIFSMKECGLRDIKLKQLRCEEQLDMGEYLIRVAETKGYSMFHLITDAAIEKGIERLRADMKTGEISCIPYTPVFIGMK